MTSKQRYYNREYERMIQQTKLLYDELKLTTIFGPKTPSVEKLLNYAGTSSGLKKPNKKSLKALRRIQGVTGILWAVEKTLPKTDKKLVEKARELREMTSEAEKTLKEAANKTKKKQQKEKGGDFMPGVKSLDATSTALLQLMTCINIFKYQCEKFSEGKSNWIKTKYDHYWDRLQMVEGMKDDINSIINGNDADKINALENNLREFYSQYPGGLTPQIVYPPDEKDLEDSHIIACDTAISKAKNLNEPEPQEDTSELDLPIEITDGYKSDSGLDIEDLF